MHTHTQTHTNPRRARTLHILLLCAVVTFHLGGCDDDGATQSNTDDTFSTQPDTSSTTQPDTSTTQSDIPSTEQDTPSTQEDVPTNQTDTQDTSTTDEDTTTTQDTTTNQDTTTTQDTTSEDTSTDDTADTADTTPIPDTWWTPTCNTVSGTASITFSHNEGQTLAAGDGALSGVTYLWGVSAMPGRPGHMVALKDQRLLFSTDAGCTWTNGPTLNIDSSVSRITPTSGDIAYVWADNGTAFHRVNVVTQTVEWSGNTPATIKGVGVDDKQGGRVAFGDEIGRLQISLTGGETWERGNGNPAAQGDLVLGYRVFFDPNDIDHAVFGQASEGAAVTFNGGATWTPSTGLSYREGGGVNAFELVISPANPLVVWAAALDVAEQDETENNGRHIYLSTDGGLTFEVAYTADAQTTIINGPVMAAHPTDDTVFYWIFGTYFQGYGTDIYRYDAATQTMTFTHNQHDDISSITFNPADPGTMYFGLVSEDIQ